MMIDWQAGYRLGISKQHRARNADSRRTDSGQALNYSFVRFFGPANRARTQAWTVFVIAACATALLCISLPVMAQTDRGDACLVAGQWATQVGAEFRQATAAEVVAQARDVRFVMLGEAHDNADHHLWQLQALGMLLGARNELVIGMEMFPRRVQPVLDRWIAGELTESELLQQTEWARVWRFDPDLYLPILRFARLNRISVVALNVERSLISEIGASGLQAIPSERREGVTDPAPASTDYRDILESSFLQHSKAGDSEFENFVDAQLFWDRAFAQGLADSAAVYPMALIVGIMGSGHLRYGHGVPHQLRAMGHRQAKVWLPMNVSTSCDQLSEVADSVFAVHSNPVHSNPVDAKPRLGVYLGDDAGAAGVREVVAGSVAQGAGLMSGDRILAAAGLQIRSSEDLIAIVRRQSPGTWLPMTVERKGEKLELVAKFPAGDSASVGADTQHDSNRDEQEDN
jgi:uncharacterized iron-regulated protein